MVNREVNRRLKMINVSSEMQEWKSVRSSTLFLIVRSLIFNCWSIQRSLIPVYCTLYRKSSFITLYNWLTLLLVCLDLVRKYTSYKFKCKNQRILFSFKVIYIFVCWCTNDIKLIHMIHSKCTFTLALNFYHFYR